MERDNQIHNYNHTFNLVERKNVSISGVKKIESFDSEEFLIETVMGIMILKGEGLELIKLDTLLHICEGFNISLGEFFTDSIFDNTYQESNKD